MKTPRTRVRRVNIVTMFGTVTNRTLEPKGSAQEIIASHTATVGSVSSAYESTTVLAIAALGPAASTSAPTMESQRPVRNAFTAISSACQSKKWRLICAHCPAIGV